MLRKFFGIGFHWSQGKRLGQVFILPTGEIMLERIHHFSQGMVIGSKQFLKEVYAKYGGEIIGNNK